MPELATQSVAQPSPVSRLLPQASIEARQVDVGQGASARIGPRVWRGLALALAIECVVLWSVLAADGWLAWVSSGFGLTLLALAVIDIDRFRLPNALTYPLLPVGLCVAYLISPENLLHHIAGAAAGFLFFAGFRLLYFRLRHREGLGLGDVKLMAALGAWLSWQGLPSAVLIGAAVALGTTLVRRAAGQTIESDHRLPFGAYLAAGAWLVWLYGPITVF